MEFLRSHPGLTFSVRQITRAIYAAHGERYGASEPKALVERRLRHLLATADVMRPDDRIVVIRASGGGGEAGYRLFDDEPS